MNKQLQDYARDTLKAGLLQTTEMQQLLFKKMYSHKNLNMPIEDVVDNLEAEKLDWAMQQVQRTIDEKVK